MLILIFNIIFKYNTKEKELSKEPGSFSLLHHMLILKFFTAKTITINII